MKKEKIDELKDDITENATKAHKWLSTGVSGNRWAVVGIAVASFLLGAWLF
jgi:hypothetical protein